MKKYICWYAYQGHETEGHLSLEEPASFDAEDKSAALYKYLCLRAFRNKEEPYHKTLSEHRRSKYCEGGWGFFVKELSPTESASDDTEWFKGMYKQYNR